MNERCEALKENGRTRHSHGKSKEKKRLIAERGLREWAKQNTEEAMERRRASNVARKERLTGNRSVPYYPK